MKILFALLLTLGFTAVAQQKQPLSESPNGVEFKHLPPSMRSMGLFDDMGEGDTLLEVNEHKVKRAKELEEIFKDIKPGTEVKLKVNHNGKVEERKKKSK